MMTMAQALEQWTSDTIKKYINLLGGRSSLTRKADRIAYLCAQLLQPENLSGVWSQLNPIAQRAVSTAYHNGGQFDIHAFAAQYGQLPPRPQNSRYYSYYKEPILFDLFVIDGVIPADLMPLLADLVLPAERFQLEGIETPPDQVSHWGHNYTVVQAETEITGRTDLLTYLQLVEQGALKWSPKNKQLTAASIRRVYANLMAGDFHSPPDKVVGRYVIRPFGLDIFTQEAGLVSGTGDS